MTRSAAETREHVLGVARDLFYWHGIKATGVDRLATEAGVSPTTLYRLFADKDDLVAAYVEREAQRYQEWFEQAVDVRSEAARERILSLFEALEEQVNPQVCRGCPFQMALAETPDPAFAAHENAVALKTWVRSRLLELVNDLGAETAAPDPEGLADHLFLMMEGVYASAGTFGSAGPARRARELVERLLPQAPETSGQARRAQPAAN